jgi:hypothetical protein
MVDFGYDVISIKQVTTARRFHEGTTTTNLPLLLITLAKTTKSQEIFSLCHISINVELYKLRNVLTQC